MKWLYEVVQSFNQDYYSGLIDVQNLIQRIVFDNQKVWELRKNKKKYLLSLESEKDLPLKITNTTQVNDGKVVYDHIKSYETVRFKQERSFDFREIVNTYCDFKHSNTDHWLLWRIVSIGAYLGRFYCRVASDAAFGKDSAQNGLKFLTNRIDVFSPHSMAAIEYRLLNESIAINELSDLPSEQVRSVQQFLLNSCGDSLKYEKSTRGTAGYGTLDTYDISRLSIVIMYNIMGYYEAIGRKDSYFDFMFTKAVQDRLLPLKFEGVLNIEQFSKKVNAKREAEKYKLYFVKTLRSLEWYKYNHYSELKGYKVLKDDYPMGGRHFKHFSKICEYIDLYSTTEKEFKRLVGVLYGCYRAYNEMLIADKGNLISYTEEDIE